MTPFERQNAIIDILSRERHTTIEKLATTFDVSERTIRNDITALSSRCPITTIRGRYGGGVEVASWFQPNAHILAPEQEELLERLKSFLEGNDLAVLNSILPCLRIGRRIIVSREHLRRWVDESIPAAANQ